MRQRSDAALRQACPMLVMALLVTYEAATNRTITLDHMRVRALSELVRREITPDDLVMVIRYVRSRAKEPKTHGMSHGFSDASVGFQNLLMDVNKFEDRLLEAREAILSKAWKTRGKKPVMLQVAAGPVNTLVESETVRAPEPMRKAMAGALSDLARLISEP